MGKDSSPYSLRGITRTLVEALTKERFAKIWGVSPNHVYKWSNDREYCDATVDGPLVRLARTFDESIAIEKCRQALIAYLDFLEMKVGRTAIPDPEEDEPINIKSHIPGAGFSANKFLESAWEMKIPPIELKKYHSAALKEFKTIMDSYELEFGKDAAYCCKNDSSTQNIDIKKQNHRRWWPWRKSK
jgi:hypothetical protein